jgi:hypothetical protein
MVMAALDNVVADVVVVAVVSPRDHVVVVPVSVHIDMLVVMVMPARAVLVVLGRRVRRDEDDRGCDQGCKACLHRSNLLGVLG